MAYESYKKDTHPFEVSIDEYAGKIQRWLSEVKPWLDPAFRMADISNTFAINRTYVSRIFNRIFGESFSSTIRKYRVEHARKLLQSHRDFHLPQIAEMSGFRSASTLIRSYVAVYGITPRADLARHDNDISGNTPSTL